MKKVFGIIAGLFLFTQSIFCLRFVNFSFTPETGFSSGTVDEFVFSYYTKNTDHLLSKLTWDISTLPFIGGTFQTELFKFITIDLSGRYYFPRESGVMQDYDWLNPWRWPSDPHTELTNYSNSPNFLNTFYTFNAKLGCNFTKGYFSFSPFLMYEYNYIFFDAIGGYKIYKSDSFVKQQLDDVKVISYKEILQSGLIGVRIGLKNEIYYVGLSFAISPKLTFVDCYDYHYINKGSSGTLFWDNLDYTLYYKTQLVESLEINEYEKIGIKIEWDFYPRSYGVDKSRDITTEGKLIKGSDWSKENELGGTSRSIFSFSINYTLTL